MNPRRLLLIFYALIPLAIYHVPLGVLNISFDRLMLVFVVGILVAYPFGKVKRLMMLVRLLLLATALSMLFADDYQLDGLIKFGPSWIQSILVMYISVVVANKYGGQFINKIFRIHFFTLFVLTLYGFWFVYIQDNITFKYPLDAFLPDLANDEHKVGMLRHSRMFFPFSSAPRLGFVAGLLMIFFFYYSKTKRQKWLMVGGSLFVVLVTISRGPVVSVAVSFALAYLIKNFYRGKIHYLLVFGIVVAILGAAFTLISVADSSTFARLFSFGSDDASLQGHLGIRFRVLDMIFTNNLHHFFFGYGLGQIEHQLAISSAHSSYFTQLFEQGIFGVIAFATMYILLIGKAWRYYKTNPTREVFALFIIAIYLAIIHFAYDALSMVILWAYNGLVWGYINYRERNNGA